MKTSCRLLFAMGTLSMAGVCAAEPVTTDAIRQRGVISTENPGRLIGVMQKAARGEDITIAAIGGSITAGGLQTKDPKNRYIARFADWFTKTFPQAKVQFVNAGIGGTNSVYGAMRVKGDVLSKKPDLVIVEFGVNDKAPPIFPLSYEGVLRQILKDPRKPAVIELFFMHADGGNEQEPQQKLGQHYGLPMVSFRDAWWPEIKEGRAKWEDMYADVVHPNDVGHTLTSELLISLLEDAKLKSQAGTAPPVPDLPAPLHSDVFENCRFTRIADLKPTENSGWTLSENGKSWESPAADAAIELGFSGKILFLGYDLGKGAEPFATFSIDGGDPQPLKTNGDRLPLAENLAAGDHRIRIEFAASNLPTGSTDKIKIWGLGTAGGQ